MSGTLEGMVGMLWGHFKLSSVGALGVAKWLLFVYCSVCLSTSVTNTNTPKKYVMEQMLEWVVSCFSFLPYVSVSHKYKYSQEICHEADVRVGSFLFFFSAIRFCNSHLACFSRLPSLHTFTGWFLHINHFYGKFLALAREDFVGIWGDLILWNQCYTHTHITQTHTHTHTHTHMHAPGQSRRKRTHWGPPVFACGWEAQLLCQKCAHRSGNWGGWVPDT